MQIRSVAGCLAALACTGASMAAIGADIVYTSVTGVTTYGPVSGKYAYALGSWTCNIGDLPVEWNIAGMNGAPGLAMNIYRIHDGRLVQLGQSFVKHSCCAAEGPGCATEAGQSMTCTTTAGSTELGIGCLDSYSSSYNGGQSRLGPKSAVNPWTGVFGTYSTGLGDAIFKRCQVNQTDMSSVSFPGAQWIAEGVYVSTRDAQSGNRNNNASYRLVTNAGNGATLTPTGAQFLGKPAIQAWRDHGLGANVPDTSVTVSQADVPGEGRYWFACKTRNNGNGTWRYEYAVFNLSSEVAGGSISIPVPAGVTVSNWGFNAPTNHSGEIYNNDQWVFARNAGDVTFATAQTYAAFPNANALRWGSMYNFWFDASTAPAAGTQNATLGLFKPSTPSSISLAVSAPSAPPVPVCDSTDFNNDGLLPDTADIDDFLSVFSGGPCSTGNCNDIDFNNDGLFPDTTDIDALLSVFSGGPCA
ncbi:MAG TPA: hypothetical protein VHN77_10105 [Phycisphaerales bacterium]|nr:hypothetical protein [Phycisphaerales bacterium]